MQASETTETTIPMVIPPAEYTPIIIPSVCLVGADSLTLYVNSKHGGVIDIIKFVRSGNSFVTHIVGGAP